MRQITEQIQPFGSTENVKERLITALDILAFLQMHPPVNHEYKDDMIIDMYDAVKDICYAITGVEWDVA